MPTHTPAERKKNKVRAKKHKVAVKKHKVKKK
jgi:hypothetical protein